MNKRRILLSVILITAIVLVGCSQKDPEPRTIAKGQIDLSELGTEDATGEAEENEEAIEEIPEEQVVSYECMEEIKEASPDSGLVQIDDVIIEYGCKISEMMEKIENSQSIFGYYDDYTYNENELVLSNDSVDMLFAKDGDFYFQIQARNLTDETISLKDCVVGRIITEESAKGNIFYAGFNAEGDNAITYDYVKNVVMKDYKLESEISELDSGNIHKKYIKMYYVMPYADSKSGELWLYFVFDSDTGELNRIMMNSI